MIPNKDLDLIVNLQKALDGCFIVDFGLTEDEYPFILFDNGAKLILESYILDEG